MRLQLLFSAIHKRCGQDLMMIDYRIKTREDFCKITNGELEPLTIFCSTCAEHVQPHYYEAWEIDGTHIQEIVSRSPIEKLKSTVL